MHIPAIGLYYRLPKPMSVDAIATTIKTATAESPAVMAQQDQGHHGDAVKAEASHQEYLDKLKVPSRQTIETISQTQLKKEDEVRSKLLRTEKVEEGVIVGAENVSLSTEERRKLSAEKIQRTYRGHRSRRQLAGLSLDPSTRWVDAITEAKYRNMNQPRQRSATIESQASIASTKSSSEARRRWQHAGEIARHAIHDDEKSTSSTSSSPASPSRVPSDPAAGAFQAHFKQQEKKEKEAWKAKTMDLTYFLEMVDAKHRYGSNLRAYHMEWKKSKTLENFFYWLDHGEGKNLELSTCPRARLEKEQVRYLSREERMKYMVDFDDDGKLRWCKNGELIDTTAEYRDSVEGIVPQEDKAKPYHAGDLLALQEETTTRTDSMDVRSNSASSHDSSSSKDEEGSSAKEGPQKTKKVIQMSPAVIFNRLLRKFGEEKENNWLFVCDQKMNLYVGIKQSGSFQHSSFLHGSRIAAAGLIKIQKGQLRSLSPLSGHYRPPTSAFKQFIAHLKAEGVDLSRMSISKSYAVLLGLETYARGKNRMKKFGANMEKGIGRVAHPKEAKAEGEKEKEKERGNQRVGSTSQTSSRMDGQEESYYPNSQEQKAIVDRTASQEHH